MTGAPTSASLLESLPRRAQLAEAYVDAYRRYCWPVNSVDDLTRAVPPAGHRGEGPRRRNQLWHMETLAKLCWRGRLLLMATPHQVVDVTDPQPWPRRRWWEELTARGGEGMVVKPLDFVARGRRGSRAARGQVPRARVPAHHLRPEYTAPENLERLRRAAWREAVARAREFALGVEALERFVAASRCAGSTSASSACWPWRASRWIRV